MGETPDVEEQRVSIHYQQDGSAQSWTGTTPLEAKSHLLVVLSI